MSATKCGRCDQNGTRACTAADECDGWMYCDCEFGIEQMKEDYAEQERQANLTTAEWLAEMDAGWREMEEELPKCNKAGSKKSPCAGDVGWWYRPSDGKMFLKCERHAEEATNNYAHAQELMSPLRPVWFDEGAAGERWDDDY